ncbi:hypothetical protein CK203_002259 [Vitis vinifera]|uniref:E3 ubiquitin-protein ligase CHFR cysteine rich domain-containing protein n=1 Tax=Vitis vinifera TaxID=29760 RepID=A0A438KJW1_VITVI|nr:hypothetical protein CK203_002259 [Vitis vinifera]
MTFLYALQISDHTISRIPTLAHENNWHEQNVLISLFQKYSSIVGVLSIKGLIFLHLRSFQITERCIRQMGKTLQDVISELLIRLSNREIDRTRMQLNHSEMITASTYVCNPLCPSASLFKCSECYDKLVSFLLYWFRVSMPKSVLYMFVEQEY